MNYETIKKLGEPTYFDRQGKELELLDWARLFEDGDYKILKQDKIGKYRVSTVWIGLNMRFFGIDPPLIFETMIFIEEGQEKDELDFWQDRYSTEDEALEGHEKALELVRNKIRSI
jgi:hypothetical protein